MSLDEIFKLASAIIVSLGGGAVIVTAAAKWCGDLLSQKLLANIEHEHEKEIEQYKARLQDMSAEFNVLLEHSMKIASKQYDMEIEIYQNIWEALHDLSMCQKHIYHFENPTQADPNEYLLILQTYSKEMEIKLEAFQKQIDSAAPFYQKDAYVLLCNIEQQYIELENIIRSSVGLTGMSDENVFKVENEILPKIKIQKDDLSGKIREYLFSLKRIPNRR